MKFISFIFSVLLLLLLSAAYADTSVTDLASEVLEKAQQIRLKNPRFNNRDLIREFFSQNPHYVAPPERKFEKNENALAKNVTILGAGPSGLIAAYTLALQGHHVTVYEKRAREAFSLRWQNVSLNVPYLIQEDYPELNFYLEEHHLIQYEMELDDPKKLRSYRVAIGDLQTSLMELCLKHKVEIRFQEQPSVHTIPKDHVIILATGAKTLDRPEFKELRDEFHFQSFPQYQTHGVAAIRYEPNSKVELGLHKDRIVDPENGINWGFKVAMAGSGVSSQAARLAHLHPSDPKFTSEIINPAIYWYIYSAKEAKSSSLPFSDPVDALSFIDFTPSLATVGAITYEDHPIILWGDGRTSSHPLTGAGLTIPFRSASALSRFVQEFRQDTARENLEKYNAETDSLARELFIKTLLVTLF